MVKVAGGGCERRRKTRATGIHSTLKPSGYIKLAIHVHLFTGSDGLIDTPIPAATKATVAGGSGGRRSYHKQSIGSS